MVSARKRSREGHGTAFCGAAKSRKHIKLTVRNRNKCLNRR